MHSIALVEDNDDLRRLTEMYLARQGYCVSSFPDAEEFLGSNYLPDLYIIDINLPEMTGLELITHIRRSNPEVGIVVLSARERSVDVAEGYGSGADIYLTKPVAPEILLAAVRRLATRGALRTAQAPSAEVLKNSIAYGGIEQQLSPKEYILLHRLSLAGNRGLERHEIANCLGLDLDNDVSKALEVRILRVRRKLSQLGLPDTSIETLRGFGYRLRAPLTFVE